LGWLSNRKIHVNDLFGPSRTSRS